MSARRARLKPAEKRQIAASHMKTGALAKIYEVAPETIRAYRKPVVDEITQRHGYADDRPAIKSLIDAYEDGRFARRKWGDSAVCHFKGEHAEAWKLGFDSK